MAHMLARLRGAKVETIKDVLLADAPKHAEQGFSLQHVWQNVDDANEVLFLFQTDDLVRAKQFIQHVHAEALKANPQANLPHITYLEER